MKKRGERGLNDKMFMLTRDLMPFQISEDFCLFLSQ